MNLHEFAHDDTYQNRSIRKNHSSLRCIDAVDHVLLSMSKKHLDFGTTRPQLESRAPGNWLALRIGRTGKGTTPLASVGTPIQFQRTREKQLKMVWLEQHTGICICWRFRIMFALTHYDSSFQTAGQCPCHFCPHQQGQQCFYRYMLQLLCLAKSEYENQTHHFERINTVINFRFMKKRVPYDLKLILGLYNLLQIVFCVCILRFVSKSKCGFNHI